MKKVVLVLAVLLLTGTCVFTFTGLEAAGLTDHTAFEAIPFSPGNRSSDPVPAEDASLLLSVGYRGLTLPVNDDGTVLIPAVPESGLTVTTAAGTTLTKEPVGEGRWRLTALGRRKTRSLTLIETGIPIVYLEPDGLELSLGSDPITKKNRQATIRILSADDNGGLLVESGAVRVKRRGNGSLGYPKRGITLTNVNEKREPVTRSFLGLPADTKYGLNSLYEDDVKIRDILSLELWNDMLLPDKQRETIRMRHCELYINGLYWGLYGFQQVVSANALGLSDGDGLVKIKGHYDEFRPLREWTEALETVCDMQDGRLVTDLLEALALIKEGSAEGLRAFDTDVLLRYMVFLQVTNAKDNTFNNVVVSRHADTGLFSLITYDADQTFALRFDPTAPLYMSIQPETSRQDRFARNYPLDGVLNMEPDVTGRLAELYFSLREAVLSPERLTSRAEELFSSLHASGALSRDRARWPDGYYTDSLDAINTFILERIEWCDEYFGALRERSSSAKAGSATS